MKKEMIPVGVGLFVLIFGASFLLPQKRGAQLDKQLRKVAIPSSIRYVALKSKSLFGNAYVPSFSDKYVDHQGNGTATADIGSGSFTAVITKIVNTVNCAWAGFWANGIQNTGKTPITGVNVKASIRVDQAYVPADNASYPTFQIVLYENGYQISFEVVGVQSPGTYSLSFPNSFTMKPGGSYTCLALIDILSHNPSGDQNNKLVTVSGKFTELKFTM